MKRRFTLFLFLYFMLIYPCSSFSQFDKNRLVIRLSDFSVINFEQKNPLGKNRFFTQSVYFTYRQSLNLSTTFSEGALRFGYEKHRRFGRLWSYYGGTDLAFGYELNNPSFGPEFDLTLYAAVGYEAGINLDLGKRFAIGIQTQFWMKFGLPIREIVEDDNWQTLFIADPDILSFNLIYKFQP